MCMINIGVGVNTLICLMQVFPGSLLQYTYRDPENPKHRLARTEVQRRDEYIKLLHQQLGEQHPLVLLVKQCLEDEPSERPSAQELLRQLEDIKKTQIAEPYQHLTKLEAMRMLKESDTQVEVGYNISSCLFHVTEAAISEIYHPCRHCKRKWNSFR